MTSRSTLASQPWTRLAAGALTCTLLATTVEARAQLCLLAAGLGVGAIAAFGIPRGRTGLPVAAVAWLGSGAVGAVLAWGLAEDYPFGYALAVFQFLVGIALLPGHLRRSARQAAEGVQAGPSEL
ncbi:hypothetical protein [[Kitasatospora] papulosa]|uniref:hypothetical protein n=1 Tax=[Kitasatospora] papulosa TaxID=1464011 RepID=UPI00362EAB7E